MFDTTAVFFTPAVCTALGVTLLAGLATVLGCFAVLFSKTPSPRVLAFGLAFSAGAMVYVSLVEIMPKAHKAFQGALAEPHAYHMATLFLFVGVAAMLLLDRVVPNPHVRLDTQTDSAPDSGTINHNHTDHHADRDTAKRLGLLAALAITAHNFPEGMATFFSTLDSPTLGLPLAVAIAIHNIPEGISIALPVYFATHSRSKALIACVISALAEPVGALIGYTILASFLSPFVYGAVFGLIAGFMVFLALDELLPTAKRYASGHETTYGILAGMATLALSLVLFAK